MCSSDLTYGATQAVETVSVDALWITDANQPEDLVYGMLKALYNPANRGIIEAQRSGAHFFDLGSAAKDATAPLHPGAVRYFTESGVLKPLPAAPSAPARKT